MDKAALKSCFRGATLKRSAMVSLIVGSALIGINQGDLILAGGMPPIWKIALTYTVPFLVASYGAYSALAGSQTE